VNIHLHIDRLILDGLPVTSAHAPIVKAAVEAELARLLTDGGLSHELHAGVAVPRVSAGPFRPSSDISAPQLGELIARSVYGGIGRAT
jgi:hypothetical protein